MIKLPATPREEYPDYLAPTHFLIRLTIPPGLMDELWELGREIRTLGGVEVDDGYLFQNGQIRDIALEFITSRWGNSYVEPVDVVERRALRLLMASSSHDECRRLGMLLSIHGVETAIVHRGTCCLDALRSYRPDVLALDNHLLWGGSDGVLAYMRAHPDVRVPVILLLSDRVSEESGSAPSLSCTFPVVACLARPIQPNALLHVLIASYS